MENDRETGELLLDFGENVEGERRGDEDSVGIFVALGRLEFLATMAGANGDREGVNAGLLDEVLNFFGFGVVAFLGGDIVFDAGQNAKLTLDGYVILLRMGKIANLLGERDVLFVGEVRSVDHDGRESAFDAVLAELERVAVIEMEDDRNIIP